MAGSIREGLERCLPVIAEGESFSPPRAVLNLRFEASAKGIPSVVYGLGMCDGGLVYATHIDDATGLPYEPRMVDFGKISSFSVQQPVVRPCP